MYHSVHCCSVRSEAAEEARTGSIRCGGGGWGEAPGKFGCSLGGHRAPVSWLTGVMLAD